MLLRVVDATFRTRPLHTRLPFKFGVQVLREVPLAELQIIAELPTGETTRGRSSDLLVPKWFKKDPETSAQEDSQELLASAHAAANLAISLGDTAGAHPVFDTWRVLNQERVGNLHRAADILVRGFGVSMVERALIDAACRHSQRSFDQALREGILAFKPGQIFKETAGWSAQDLPPPRASMAIRHTVGMLDPLTRSEIKPQEMVQDGLPQSLEEDIDAYGLRWFKVKVCGDRAIDSERLRDVARVVMPRVGEAARFTLDGNEQCLDIDAFAGMLQDLASDESAAALVQRIALVEQPLPRADTFEEGNRDAIARLSRIAPLIIDEADTDIDAFRRAIDLGYAGVSIKACKGVFRALANRALLDAMDQKHLFQSGEDLTNLASIPLQQDLALQATLGIEHVERNGHHYFKGLDHLPPEESTMLSERLADLYSVDAAGCVRLEIRDGTISLHTLLAEPGFGGPLASIENHTTSSTE